MEKPYPILGVVILLTGLLGLYLVAFDVTGPVTYDATFYGENWTITQPAPHSGYVCGKYGDITTENSAETLNIVSKLPNTGSRDCDTYNTGVSVTWNRDLRTIQRAVIHRQVSLSGSAKDGAGWASTISDKSIQEFDHDRSKNFGSVNKKIGDDVIITNDGTGIIIQAEEGRIVLDDTQAQFFKNSVSLYVKDSTSGGTLEYQITGVDVTLKTTPVLPVVVVPSMEEEPAPATQGWFARFLSWIKSLFS